jgi:hypothetical protein
MTRLLFAAYARILRAIIGRRSVSANLTFSGEIQTKAGAVVFNCHKVEE